MGTTENQETRYFIDLDIKSRKILNWDYDQRDKLIGHTFPEPSQLRIYITKVQVNKLKKKHVELTI